MPDRPCRREMGAGFNQTDDYVIEREETLIVSPAVTRNIGVCNLSKEPTHLDAKEYSVLNSNRNLHVTQKFPK